MTSQQGGLPHVPSPNENRSRKCGLCELQRSLSSHRHPYLSHRGAISTQQSTPLSFISYLTVISSGWFLIFSPCPGCRENCFLAELCECPVEPLVTTFLLQEVPLSLSQVTRGGKETFTMMWEIPSLEAKIKEDRHKGPFCTEPGTWRSSVNWTGLVHDGEHYLTGNPASQAPPQLWNQHRPVCHGSAVSQEKGLASYTKTLRSPCSQIPLYRNGLRLAQYIPSASSWNERVPQHSEINSSRGRERGR